MTQSHEVSKFCWKNGTHRHARSRVATNLQFVKLSWKHNKAKRSKPRSACVNKAPWVLIRPLTTHLHPPPQLGVGLGPSSHLQNKSGNSCAASASLGFPGSSVGKDSTCNAGDLGSIPGLGRSPGDRKGFPFQCSGLENSMDCIVHGVAKSQTRQSGFSLSVFFLLRKMPSCHFLFSPAIWGQGPNTGGPMSWMGLDPWVTQDAKEGALVSAQWRAKGISYLSTL